MSLFPSLFRSRNFALLSAALLCSLSITTARADTEKPAPPQITASIPAPGESLSPTQWIDLARRIHGGFGSYLVVGIRIGLDATKRLNAGPRDLSVLYYDGPQAPCPCVADGLMLSTGATPGQGSLRIAPTKTGRDAFGVAVVTHKKTGATLRYTIPQSLTPALDRWNRTQDETGRFEAVMNAPQIQIFSVYRVRTTAATSRS